jgi:colanic acid biosynthesis glycosyl transferase WcaI
MRVLILSQYYAPEPVPKPNELAKALQKSGHTVSVLTGFPNYPKGELYTGYRLKLVAREWIDGIPIVRTCEYPYHGKQAIGRIINYISFMLSAPLGSLFTPACDVIYVWHPPLTIGVAAWIIARLRRVPFVYDVQDIWPESAVLAGILRDGYLVRMLARLERFVYRRADHLLVVTEGARQNLMSKGVPEAKVTALPHWIDETMFTDVAPDASDRIRAKYHWEGRFVVLFAGNLGMVQGLDCVIQAASALKAHPEILIALVGDGTDKGRLRELAQAAHVEDQVQFINSQPMSRMPDFMAAADTLLVHLKRSEVSKYVIPTKTLAYLAAGKPILMAMDGAAAQLVTDAQAGRVVVPEDSPALAKAILDFYSLSVRERAAMGMRGRTYLQTHLAKDRVIAQYERLLQDVARSGERATL